MRFPEGIGRHWAPALHRRHADNFVDLVQTVLDYYKAGVTPPILAQVMMDRAKVLDVPTFCFPAASLCPNTRWS